MCQDTAKVVKGGKNCLLIYVLLYLRVFSQAVVCILVAQIYSLCSVTKIAGTDFEVTIVKQ